MHKTKTILFLCLSLLFTAQITALLKNISYSPIMQDYSYIGLKDYLQELEIQQQENNQASVQTYQASVTITAGQLGHPPSGEVTLSSLDDVPFKNTSSAFTAPGHMFTAIETADKTWTTTTTIHPRTLFATSLLPAFQGISTSKSAVAATAGGNAALLAIRQDNGAILCQFGQPDALTSQPITTLPIPAASLTTKLNTSSNERAILVAYIDTAGRAITVKLTASEVFHQPQLSLSYAVNLGLSASPLQCYIYQNGSARVVFITPSSDLIACNLDSDGSVSSSQQIDSGVSECHFHATDKVATITYAKGTDLWWTLLDEREAWKTTSKYMTGTNPTCSARQSGTCYIGGRGLDGYHNMFYKSGDDPASWVYTSSQQTSSKHPFIWAKELGSGEAINQKSFSYVSNDESTSVTGVGSSYDPKAVLKDTNSSYNRIQ